jgi:1-phosphofructokinase
MSISAPHIYTLTGNLLAERTLEFRDWMPGTTNRAERESFQVGGKGINVSKMLNRLGIANTALCFAGGAPGNECEDWLRAKGFAFHAFATTRPTRLGTVVRAPNQPETTFLGIDVAPDAAAIRACADFLDAQPAGQVLAVCGSIPGWTGRDTEPLRDALARWLSRGSLIADTYGAPLAWFAEQPLELLKVNAAELRTIAAGVSPAPSIAALRYVITDGAKAVRVREGVASEFMLTPPVIEEVSPTGSGDVLLACLIDGLFRKRKTLRDAVTVALPYAAANAAHERIAEFPDPSSRI